MAAKAVKDFMPCHTNYQIRHFMVGGAGTDYGQWRQCQREIASRLPQLERGDPVAQHEVAELLRLESELRGKLGELTPERIEQLERENWYWKVRRELVLDYIATGGPQRATLETILLLPKEDRHTLLSLIADGGKLLKNWDGYTALPGGR